MGGGGGQETLTMLFTDVEGSTAFRTRAGDTIKLIDLGGVRRVDDDQSAIYGTSGYQAPEVADVGPSVASDIFTIGANLAGLPAMSVPCGFVDGLPVGMQLIARPLAEAPLLKAAHHFQRVTGWHERVPAAYA